MTAPTQSLSHNSRQQTTKQPQNSNTVWLPEVLPDWYQTPDCEIEGTAALEGNRAITSVLGFALARSFSAVFSL